MLNLVFYLFVIIMVQDMPVKQVVQKENTFSLPFEFITKRII